MSRKDPWPYPGDAPITRVRRVAMAYRKLAHDLDPVACKDLDATMTALGQGWIAPRPIVWEDDDLLTPGETAELAGVKVGTVRALRIRGRLPGIATGKGWRYRAGDVLKLSVDPRRRTPGVTSRVSANGRTVPDGR